MRARGPLFVDVVTAFPAEVRVVLEILRDVYRNHARAREQALALEGRLPFHRAESGPLMATLQTWLDQQVAERRAESTSGIGQAIASRTFATRLGKPVRGARRRRWSCASGTGHRATSANWRRSSSARWCSPTPT